MVVTKRKIETEEDRFGGFSTRQKNRSYFADVETQNKEEQIQKQYQEFENLTEENEILFLNDDSNLEIEKSYDNLEPIEANEKQTKVLPSFSARATVKADEDIVATKSLRLSSRGIVFFSVLCSIVAILLGFVIYNAVLISNKKTTIASLETKLDAETESLESLYRYYNYLGSENAVESSLYENGSLLRQATDDETIVLYLGELQTRPVATKSTNWFDKVCNFFSSIF